MKNINNINDEEFQKFIKSELDLSLINDVKVDEELISSTLKAIESSKNKNREASIKKRKSIVSFVSMAACVCLIVMAGNFVLSNNNKAEDNTDIQMESALDKELLDEIPPQASIDGDAGDREETDTTVDNNLSYKEESITINGEVVDRYEDDKAGEDFDCEGPMSKPTEETTGSTVDKGNLVYSKEAFSLVIEFIDNIVKRINKVF